MPDRTYRRAIETTRRRLARMNWSFACSPSVDEAFEFVAGETGRKRVLAQ